MAYLFVYTEVHAYNVVVVAAVSAFDWRHCIDMAAVQVSSPTTQGSFMATSKTKELLYVIVILFNDRIVSLALKVQVQCGGLDF